MTSYRQHTVESCSFIHFENVCFSIMVLRPLTFKETVNMVRFKVAMLIFIFCLSYLYIIYFFFSFPAQLCSLLLLWKIEKDREGWCAAVHGVTKSWTWLSNYTTAVALFWIIKHFVLPPYFLRRSSSLKKKRKINGYLRASLVTQMVKNLYSMRQTQVWSLGQEDPLKKVMATHSSILAWRIPHSLWIGRKCGVQEPF